MNFISVVTEERVSMELKYCERCGGLWLRREGEAGVYCAECRARVAARDRMLGKTRGLPPAQGIAPISVLLGVAEMEVKA